jgi:hypothetical protein
VTTLLKGSCPANLAIQSAVVEQEVCSAWSRDVVERVSRDPSVDLVMTTAKTNKDWVPEDGMDGRETGVAGYVEAWDQLASAGKSVLVLSDTPRSYDEVLDCLTTRDDVRECDVPRERAMGEDDDDQHTGDGSLDEAVEIMEHPDVVLWDPTDLICGPESCPAVLGNVVVFADESHLTPTYVRTLTPYLRSQLVAALA